MKKKILSSLPHFFTSEKDWDIFLSQVGFSLFKWITDNFFYAAHPPLNFRPTKKRSRLTSLGENAIPERWE